MELQYWKLTTVHGVEYVKFDEFDGYCIVLNKLIADPTFWTEHIGDKIWGTQPVVAELAAIAASHAGGTL